MRGKTDSSWGSKTWWHFFNLLLPLLSFLLWVTELCHLHLPFSGHQSPKASSQSPVVPPSPGCRSAPSTTPEREKLVNRPINTTQIESGTLDDHGVGDKWVFRVFNALWAVSSTHSSLIWKPKITSVGQLTSWCRCLGCHTSNWGTTGHQCRGVSLVRALKHMCT